MDLLLLNKLKNADWRQENIELFNIRDRVSPEEYVHLNVGREQAERLARKKGSSPF